MLLRCESRCPAGLTLCSFSAQPCIAACVSIMPAAVRRFSNCSAHRLLTKPTTPPRPLAVALLALVLAAIVYWRRRKQRLPAGPEKAGSSKGPSTESEECAVSLHHHRWVFWCLLCIGSVWRHYLHTFLPRVPEFAFALQRTVPHPPAYLLLESYGSYPAPAALGRPQSRMSCCPTSTAC